MRGSFNVKRVAAAGVTAAILMISGATGASASTPAPTTGSGGTPTTCPAGPWPASANGRPARDPGVRVWHDGTGWHVRVTHDTMHDRVFSGELVTTGDFIAVHAVRLEKNDRLLVGPMHHGLVFRFNNYGGVDGFDFATYCAPSIEFGFVSDGHVVPTSRISIGAAASHPAHDPFRISRTA
ncbi:MAG TPA: hypothetical protein VL119_00905 [Acidimicrobiia bacterium]|nr:hypothetical protein [Acidimicrobiia bacterium]